MYKCFWVKWSCTRSTKDTDTRKYTEVTTVLLSLLYRIKIQRVDSSRMKRFDVLISAQLQRKNAACRFTPHELPRKRKAELSKLHHWQHHCRCRNSTKRWTTAHCSDHEPVSTDRTESGKTGATTTQRNIITHAPLLKNQNQLFYTESQPPFLSTTIQHSIGFTFLQQQPDDPQTRQFTASRICRLVSLQTIFGLITLVQQCKIMLWLGFSFAWK